MTESNDTLISIRLLASAASATSSTDNACAYKGNSGELHISHTKNCVNLPSCFAAPYYRCRKNEYPDTP